MDARGPGFWLLWSWRDLRRRWPLILAIGLLLAGGVGLAAGLGSMRDWRIDSNDASFSALDVHDVRVETEEGSFAPAGELARAARRIPDAGSIAALSERLILPTQLGATSADGQEVLTPGQLIGVQTGPERERDGIEVTGPEVDAMAVTGNGLPLDSGRALGVLDAQYAKANGITAPSSVSLPRGETVEVVGMGRSPETFLLLGPGGQFSSEENFGVLFVPLATAQELTGRRDSVNDLAITLEPGADAARVAGEIEREVERSLPGLGVKISGRDDIDAHRILYDDAENDQQLFDIFAFLILAGSAFGAFNLVSRTVEAQRREVGIGMALGVPPARLAVRPLLMGLQIAVIGVVLGIGVGLLVNAWLRSLLVDQLPLPILETGFQAGTFSGRAAIGFAIPILAAAWPVWRSVRVTPIDAIEIGFRAARGGGLAPALGRLPLPGGSLAQMPVRNVLRAPRRTLLTVLASGAVLAVAVSMSGMIDSFKLTVDRNGAEELRVAPDRLSVVLDGFYATGSLEVRAVETSDAAARADAYLRLPGELRAGNAEPIEVAIETLPVADGIWTPRVSAGRLPETPGEVLIAETAAEDLGVSPGDEIVLRHPRRAGATRFATAETAVMVSGTHPDPFRFPVFVEAGAAADFGLAGATNALDVVPPDGVGADEAKRALFSLPGVASIEGASELNRTLKEGLDEFAAVIRVVTAIAVLLIILIAFNSTAINADERAREHATMFAYGLPVRAVLRLAMLESLIMGVLATALGIAIGVGILSWVVNTSLEEVLPDLGVVVSLSGSSVLLAALAGAGAMAVAPLLTVRRLRRMDVPSTLRVME